MPNNGSSCVLWYSLSRSLVSDWSAMTRSLCLARWCEIEPLIVCFVLLLDDIRDRGVVEEVVTIFSVCRDVPDSMRRREFIPQVLEDGAIGLRYIPEHSLDLFTHIAVITAKSANKVISRQAACATENGLWIVMCIVPI